MARVESSITQEKGWGRWDGPSSLGVLLLLTGLALNKWSIERILAPDEHIYSRAAMALIVVFELCLLLAGLWLLLKKPSLPFPAFARRTAAIGLAAGALIGIYGSLKATGVIDPYRESRSAWTTMAASEELIFQLTPQFKVLSGSLNNLSFPDPRSRELFEDKVTFIDLAAAGAAPKVQQISNTGIEVPDWKVATEPRAEPVASLQLWRPFMDRVEYVNFPWTSSRPSRQSSSTRSATPLKSTWLSRV